MRTNRAEAGPGRALAVALLAVVVASPLAAQQGGFVTRRGADTLAVERFTRTADRLHGEFDQVATGSRGGFEARLTADARIAELTLRGAPEAADPRRVTLRFRGDSATVTASDATPPRQDYRPGAGAMPYENLVFSLLEQVVRRAYHVGDDVVAVPLLTRAGQSFTASVARIGADSVTITLPPGVVIRARAAADGALLGASVPAQGLRIERLEGEVALPAPRDYSAPAGAPYLAEEVRVQTPAGHVLAGTLTLPRGARGRVPAVVLITGSGPQDRDQAIAAVAGYRPFRQIADTLSRRGIAVLRLDDRGIGASGGHFEGATSADFASDVRAAVSFLRTRREIDPRRVALLGHSEGGIVAPMVADGDPHLRAVVLVAAPAWTGYRISDFQLREAWRAQGMTEEQMATMARINHPAREAMAAQNAWWRYFLDYDPLPTARRLRQPVLILHGETDRQVSVEQAGELAEAIRSGGNARVDVRTFPELNHLLLPDPVGRAEGYAALPSKQVPRAVLGALADWMIRALR
jgi:uncharacterized protein